jgi:hypothetical protein
MSEDKMSLDKMYGGTKRPAGQNVRTDKTLTSRQNVRRDKTSGHITSSRQNVRGDKNICGDKTSGKQTSVWVTLNRATLGSFY